jgi:beta-glucosidase
MSLTLSSGAYSNYPKTDMGWEICPDEFIDLIKMVRDKYTDLPIYITENGSAWVDVIEDGRIHDKGRTDFLVSHLQAIAKMNEMNLNVAGYYCWSLLDNFEWGHGYKQRFGIVYVDFETQQRIKKDSYYKYNEIIKEHRI